MPECKHKYWRLVTPENNATFDNTESAIRVVCEACGLAGAIGSQVFSSLLNRDDR